MCGFLSTALAGMRDHVIQCHVDSHGNPRAEQEELLLTPEVLHRRLPQDSEDMIQGACVDWWGGMRSLLAGGQRQTETLVVTQGSTTSIADLRKWTTLFHHLVSCAAFPGEDHGCVPLRACVDTFFVFWAVGVGEQSQSSGALFLELC